MSYYEWFKEHAKKHKEIVKKCDNLSTDELINYFSYENMKKCETYFCPLYELNQKCHDIVNLNCFLCGCPYFRFNFQDVFFEDKRIASFCTKGLGDKFEFDGVIHCDCSNCLVPHNIRNLRNTIRKNGTDWKNIMKGCINEK